MQCKSNNIKINKTKPLKIKIFKITIPLNYSGQHQYEKQTINIKYINEN